MAKFTPVLGTWSVNSHYNLIWMYTVHQSYYTGINIIYVYFVVYTEIQTLNFSLWLFGKFFTPNTCHCPFPLTVLIFAHQCSMSVMLYTEHVIPFKVCIGVTALIFFPKKECFDMTDLNYWQQVNSKNEFYIKIIEQY